MASPSEISPCAGRRLLFLRELPVPGPVACSGVTRPSRPRRRRSESLSPLKREDPFYFLDLAVSFVASFALIAGWGRTLGMRPMGLYAVEGRNPVDPVRAAIGSLVADVLTVIPAAAIVDLLWPLWTYAT